MGLLHVSKMKFRLPVPHVFTKRKANYYAEDEQLMDRSSMATSSQVIVARVHKFMVFKYRHE